MPSTALGASDNGSTSRTTINTNFSNLDSAVAAVPGTVTSVSVTTANGVSGSVATATSTPAITLSLGAITPSSAQISGLTASQILSTDASKNLTSLAVATYPSLTELTYVKGVTSAIQTQLGTKAPSTSPTFATSVTGSYLTASEILVTDASKNIVSAPVATYPSLTELTYLKGVTSAIQTQINSKQASGSYLTSSNIVATITNGVTTNAPSEDAVFDALALKAPLASPTFTGTVVVPTPFTLGATSVTSTGTQLNYLASATGTTGTTSQKVVFDTSPTLVTPTLGVASATSINKMAITAPATSSTLAVADGKTLTASNTLTLTGTDSSSVAFGTGGTVAYERTATVCIPQHALGVPGFPSATTYNSNTTMRIGMVMIPYKITVNNVTIRTETHTTNGTLDITLYSEDGQTQLFSVTTGTISAANTLYTTAVSSVVLQPGNYYLGINTNSTTSTTSHTYGVGSATPFTTTASLANDVGSQPVLQGTLTITADTPPATIDPTAITDAVNSIPIVRFDT